MSINKIKSLIIISAVAGLAYNIHAEVLTANQSGNIVHVRYGQQQFTLIGDPGFSYLTAWKIEIPLKKEEEKKIEAPAHAPAHAPAPAPAPAPEAAEPTAKAPESAGSAPAPAPGVTPEGNAKEAAAAEELIKEENKGKPDVSSKLFMANQMYLKEKYLKAFAYIQEAIDLDPNNARAWAMRGSLFDATGDHEKAVEDWQKAYDFAPAGSTLRNELVTKLPRK